MKKVLYFFLSIIFSYTAAYATDLNAIKNDITEELNNKNFNGSSTRIYCLEQNGKTSGENMNRTIIPASVSKLFTTEWALNVYGEDKIFTTKFKYKNNILYIEGSGDPTFQDKQMIEVLEKLRVKYPKMLIQKIVYNNNFYYLFTSSKLGTGLNLKNLKKSSNKLPVDKYISVRNQSTLKLDSYDVAFKSRPLKETLKEMNIFSTNSTAEILYNNLGGQEKYAKYLKDKFSITPSETYLQTGSGIFGNYTDCRSILKILKSLQARTNARNYHISEIMSVPPIDKGSMGKKFSGMNLEKSFVAKDGYLYGANSIAGITYNNDGPIYFAFVVNYEDRINYYNAVSLLETFAKTLVDKAESKRFEYTPVSY